MEIQAFNCTQKPIWPSKFICDTEYREASEKSLLKEFEILKTISHEIFIQ